MARSLADLKKSNGPRDHVAELREAIKGIPKGKYETTKELCLRAGISLTVPVGLVDKFPDNAVRMRRGYGLNRDAYMWARTPADAKKLRDALKSQNG